MLNDLYRRAQPQQRQKILGMVNNSHPLLIILSSLTLTHMTMDLPFPLPNRCVLSTTSVSLAPRTAHLYLCSSLPPALQTTQHTTTLRIHQTKGKKRTKKAQMPTTALAHLEGATPERHH